MDQEYSTVTKGTGVLYVCANLLYRRVKTAGNVKYLKCTTSGCHGSAKLVGDQFFHEHPSAEEKVEYAERQED